MKKWIIIIVFGLLAINTSLKAGDFGIGIKLGEPLGLTGKFKLGGNESIGVDLGSSYFGNPRINVDYLLDFNAFNSKNVKLYAGFGGVIGFGEGNDYIYHRGKDKFYHHDGIGIGARALFGINFMPKNTPLEIFAELGVMVGLIPNFGANADPAIGIRFYP